MLEFVMKSFEKFSMLILELEHFKHLKTQYVGLNYFSITDTHTFQPTCTILYFLWNLAFQYQYCILASYYFILYI